jgi:formate dehydrogenase major subunit
LGSKEVQGRITLVQEQRFRLVTDDGRVLLLTLAHNADADLRRLQQSGASVRVEYDGEPNFSSGVAHRVWPASPEPSASLADWSLPGQQQGRVGLALADWSLPRQLRGQSPYSAAAESESSRTARPRLQEADKVGTSICPYCAVGCAQLIYAKGDDVIHVEGDPRSPINQGTLCPKGAATLGWMLNPNRLTHVKYRAPYSDRWEERPLDWAMERIAQLVKQTRDETFVDRLPDGKIVNHTLGIAELGGATCDDEENYLIKKLCGGGLGMVFIENQARI